MASKKKVRKKHVPRRPATTEPQQYAEFMRDVMDDVIRPVQLFESRGQGGALELDFDEEVDE